MLEASELCTDVEEKEFLKKLADPEREELERVWESAQEECPPEFLRFINRFADLVLEVSRNTDAKAGDSKSTQPLDDALKEEEAKMMEAGKRLLGR